MGESPICPPQDAGPVACGAVYVVVGRVRGAQYNVPQYHVRAALLVRSSYTTLRFGRMRL